MHPPRRGQNSPHFQVGDYSHNNCQYIASGNQPTEEVNQFTLTLGLALDWRWPIKWWLDLAGSDSPLRQLGQSKLGKPDIWEDDSLGILCTTCH